MGQLYVGSLDAESPILPVNAGDTVLFRAVGEELATRDAFGRWPHIIYRPGAMNAPKGAAQYHATPNANDHPVIFRDDGAFVASFPGQCFIGGGSGRFKVDFAVRRDMACEKPERYPWKLSHYTTTGNRLLITTIPSGIQWIEVTVSSRVEIFHGTGATDVFTAADPQNGRMGVQDATRIDFEPTVREGQIIFHGIM